MMVPLGGFNFISLLNGKGLKYKYNKGRIKVEEVEDYRPNIRIFKVSGLKYGETELQAGNIKVVVSVKKPIQVSLAFNIVRVDGQATAANVASVGQMVKFANDILTPQANIKILHLYPVKSLIVKSNRIRQIRPFMRGKGLPEDSWDDLVKLGDNTHGAKNVFFIKELYKSPMKRVLEISKGMTYENNIMIPWKNSMTLFARTLAHETIHTLGFDSYYHTYKGTLLDESTSTLLPKKLVDIFNR